MIFNEPKLKPPRLFNKPVVDTARDLTVCQLQDEVRLLPSWMESEAVN